MEETEERREFTAPFWVARIMAEAGYAKITEDGLTAEEWTQIHFKERFKFAFVNPWAAIIIGTVAGIVLLLWGVVTSLVISAVGLVVIVLALAGWIGEMQGERTR